MFNPFPDLLWLSFFAPTILRLAAAGVLFAGAYVHFKNKDTNSKALAGAHALVGAMLFFGWNTQYAALLGMAGVVLSFLLPTRITKTAPLSISTSGLLFAIFLSLLVSGAGAFAFDLPL